jgi:cobalamin biosynthesis protein CobT
MKYYGRVKPALQLAAVFCEALSRADIPCEVTSFTTDSPNGKRVDTKYGTRREPLLLTVLKDFNESFRNTQAYWGGISSHCMDNIDGESIMMAAQRLHKRQESRKVMIVLSDGMPAGVLRRGYGDDHIENDLKDTIKRCERAGIETLGIGIQTDAVKEFYPKYAVYQNLNTMISDVYQKISVLLRHGTLS